MYRGGNQINSWGFSSLGVLYPPPQASLILWQFSVSLAASAFYEWNIALRTWLVWRLHLSFSKPQGAPGKGSAPQIPGCSGWKGPLEVTWTKIPAPAAGARCFLGSAGTPQALLPLLSSGKPPRGRVKHKREKNQEWVRTQCLLSLLSG